MLSVTQIQRVIENELNLHPSQAIPEAIASAAEKIYDLVKPDYSIHVAAAALENEVTSTLMDMLAATILATLIDEEGGGRTNIRFSPGSMQEKMAEWNYTVEHEDMVRNVRITPKDSSAWDNSEPPSKLGSLLMGEDGPIPEASPLGIVAQPQAAPHEYNRPVWVVACSKPDGGKAFFRQHDRRGAERELRSWSDKQALESNAHIENRWCLHPECPASGCEHDPALRDPEVTSDEKSV